MPSGFSLYDDVGFHGIGDETLLVSVVVKRLFLFGRGTLVTAVDNSRIQRNRADPRHVALVLLE